MESPLSIRILSGDFKDGDEVEVDITEDSKITFEKIAESPKPKKSSSKKKDDLDATPDIAIEPEPTTIPE